MDRSIFPACVLGAGIKAMNPGDLGRVAAVLRATRAPAAAIEMITKSVLTGTDGGNALLGLPAAFSVFVNETFGAVATMRADGALRPIKARMRLIVAGGSATASVPGEGRPVPIVSGLNLSATPTESAAVRAAVVVSKEILVNGIGETVVSAALDTGFGTGVDQIVWERGIDSSSPESLSAGSSADHALADLDWALSAVNKKAGARLYFVTSPALGAKACTLAHSSGVRVFPDASAISGAGSWLGVPVLFSEAVASDDVLLVNAAQLAIGFGDVRLGAFADGDVEVSDAPTQNAPAGVAMVSLWQNNLIALTAETEIVVERLADDAIVRLQSVAWSNPVPPS